MKLLTYELELIFDLMDNDPYLGFENLKNIIDYHDELSEIKEPLYTDVLASAIIYQQLVEKLLLSLINKNEIYTKVKNFPSKYIVKSLNIKQFGNVIKMAKGIYNFENKDKLINHCNRLNKIRIQMAHYITEIKRLQLIEYYSEIKKLYSEIFEVCQKEIFDFANNIHDKLMKPETYMISPIDNYVKDKLELYSVLRKRCLDLKNVNNIDWTTAKYYLLYKFLDEYIKSGTSTINLNQDYIDNILIAGIKSEFYIA